jgi:hypothetical protein
MDGDPGWGESLDALAVDVFGRWPVGQQGA